LVVDICGEPAGGPCLNLDDDDHAVKARRKSIKRRSKSGFRCASPYME
tara:strand:+ start:23201 stop:23344 length:144 start_codon:yes stop_codon:yes gene_type:complete